MRNLTHVCCSDVDEILDAIKERRADKSEWPALKLSRLRAVLTAPTFFRFKAALRAFFEKDGLDGHEENFSLKLNTLRLCDLRADDYEYHPDRGFRYLERRINSLALDWGKFYVVTTMAVPQADVVKTIYTARRMRVYHDVLKKAVVNLRDVYHRMSSTRLIDRLIEDGSCTSYWDLHAPPFYRPVWSDYTQPATELQKLNGGWSNWLNATSNWIPSDDRLNEETRTT